MRHYLQPVLYLLIAFISFPVFPTLSAQEYKQYQVHNDSYLAEIDSVHFLALREEFGRNKVYPKAYALPILIALAHYPELKEVSIHFMETEQAEAHNTMPLPGTLLAKKAERIYVVNISTKVRPGLEATMSSRLNYNARIGVMGHELAHIAWYDQRNTFQLIGASIGYLFKGYRMRMEQATDRSTIDHLLGPQLKAWSEAVHPTHIKDGRGDLYMAPEEIDTYMAEKGFTP